jgi:pyrophosphatase PpaX
MKANCILFDLDGTLLNTNDLVLESLTYTIRIHTGKDVPFSELYNYFGRPLVDIMADLDPSRTDEMVKTYREYNSEKHDVLTKVFPGVPETLAELKQKNIPLGVVTSKMKNLAYRGLRLFGIESYFDVFIAYEDTNRHKPDPEPILKALQQLASPGGKQVLMVGDSPFDIVCAGNAGVTSVAVDWSVHPKEVLDACKPNIWLKNFSDLINYV